MFLCLNFFNCAHYYYLEWVLGTSATGCDAFKRCYGNGNFEDIPAAIYFLAQINMSQDSARIATTVILLTPATTACESKMADFIAPFVKNLASEMQLMYLVASLCLDPLEELTTRSCRISIPGKKVIKILHNVGKTSTDLQILGCELHLNVFGSPGLPGPAGGAIMLHLLVFFDNDSISSENSINTLLCFICTKNTRM